MNLKISRARLPAGTLFGLTNTLAIVGSLICGSKANASTLVSLGIQLNQQPVINICNASCSAVGGLPRVRLATFSR